jgi:putative spermidine/putrescine transport system substrate-binding protein
MLKFKHSLSLVAVFAASMTMAQAADTINVVGWGGNWDKAYKDGVWDKYTEQTGT